MFDENRAWLKKKKNTSGTRIGLRLSYPTTMHLKLKYDACVYASLMNVNSHTEGPISTPAMTQNTRRLLINRKHLHGTQYPKL